MIITSLFCVFINLLFIGALSISVAQAFSKSKITAVDGNERILGNKNLLKFRNRITPLWENILFPTNPEKMISDVVLFTEVRLSIEMSLTNF